MPSTAAQSPEQRLLRHACRTDTAAPLQQDLADFRDSIDWTELVQLAMDHGVAGLLCSNLLAVPPTLVPGEIIIAARQFLEQQQQTNQELFGQLCAILDTLEQAGIPAIPFKGPTLAFAAYGGLEFRTFRDLDMLIREQDIRPCLDRLHETGYTHERDLTPRQWQEFFNYDAEEILRGPGVPVEPHWRFAPRTLAIDIDYDRLWERATRKTVGGHTMLQMAPEDELIAVCLHGCKEEWTRLKWVADVAAFVARHDDLDWDAVIRLSTQQGVARIVRIGLLIADRLIGIAAPPQIKSWSAGDDIADHWSSAFSVDFFATLRETPDVFRIGPFHRAMRERKRDKVRYIVRTLTQPTNKYFADISIPDRLFFLYWPYKLAHDYIALPIHLMLKSTRHDPH